MGLQLVCSRKWLYDVGELVCLSRGISLSDKESDHQDHSFFIPGLSEERLTRNDVYYILCYETLHSTKPLWEHHNTRPLKLQLVLVLQVSVTRMVSYDCQFYLHSLSLRGIRLFTSRLRE